MIFLFKYDKIKKTILGGETTIFPERLKQVRKQKGLTLEELAQLYNEKFNSGLNKGTLSKYENNKQEPMMSVVHNLSILLNVSADYLLGSSHTPTPQGENSEFISTIQQAVRKATPKQREKMLQLMKLSFEDLFEND